MARRSYKTKVRKPKGNAHKAKCKTCKKEVWHERSKTIDGERFSACVVCGTMRWDKRHEAAFGTIKEQSEAWAADRKRLGKKVKVIGGGPVKKRRRK